MDRIIIYGSQYGTTKQYADELSKRTGIEAISYDKKRNLLEYKLIIYIGAIYSGDVKGLKETLQLIPKNYDGKFIIVTVGLTDIENKTNVDHINEALKKQLPHDIYEKLKVFHLRGEIDYNRLNSKHRAMMTILYNKVKSIPENKRTDDMNTLLKTFNQNLNYIDYNKLDNIINNI